MSYAVAELDRRDFIRRLIRDQDTVRPFFSDTDLHHFEMEALTDWSSIFPQSHRTYDYSVSFTSSGVNSKRRGFSAVGFVDFNQITRVQQDAGGAQSATINYDPSGSLTTGKHAALVVFVAIRDPADPSLTSMSWAGLPLSRVARVVNGNLGNEVWMLRNPPIGNFNLAWSISASSNYTLELFHLTSVVGGGPVGFVTVQAWGGTSGSGAAVSTTIRPTQSLFHSVFDLINAEALPGGYTPGAGQTALALGFVGASAGFYEITQKGGSALQTTMSGTITAPLSSWVHLAIAFEGAVDVHPTRLVRATADAVEGRPLEIVDFTKVTYLQESEGRAGAGLVEKVGIRLASMGPQGVTITAAIYPSGLNTVFLTFVIPFLGLSPGYGPPFYLADGDVSESYYINRIAAYRAAGIMGVSEDELDQILIPLPERVLAAFNLTKRSRVAHVTGPPSEEAVAMIPTTAADW